MSDIESEFAVTETITETIEDDGEPTRNLQKVKKLKNKSKL